MKPSKPKKEFKNSKPNCKSVEVKEKRPFVWVDFRGTCDNDYWVKAMTDQILNNYNCR